MIDDNEYSAELQGSRAGYAYHEICLWLPYNPQAIDDISNDMLVQGYRTDRPIILFEGKILDGRHRYEAAQKVGVEPQYVNFDGTEQEAITYVTSENVNRRHLNNQEKEFFYVQRAEALGVQSRGGDRKSKINTSNDGMVPSAQEHADALGVSRPTVERWENTRKEIKADPELSQKAKTLDGYKEAKKEVKERRKASVPVVPPYNVDEAMGAIKGIAQMYGKRYEGTVEEASHILLNKILEGHGVDGIGLSIARDYARWFLSLKEVLDLAEPELRAFLIDRPNLKSVD